MLSEFECETCQTKFVAAFMEVRPGFSMQHCVACGRKDLKYLGSSEAIIREVAVQEAKTLKELVAELEKIEDELDRMPSEMSGFARSGTLHERRLNLLSAIVKRVVVEELHELK